MKNTISTEEALIAPQIASGKPQTGASSAVMKAPDSRERPASILDPAFEYTPARATTADYLRRKFKRIQREQKANEQERAVKVAPIPQRRKTG